jgi:hypothetical protein
MDYIHFNSVKDGVVAHPTDWPFASFPWCVALGIFSGIWVLGNVRHFPLGYQGMNFCREELTPTA